jgi:cytochrome c oxidase assembly protein subunit 15
MVLSHVQPGSRTGVRVASDRLAPVRAWLWSVAALVLLMVVVGGATRLTESGLSITEWKLVSGIVPPLSAAQWQEAFDKYKAIPQYSQLFPTMTLGDFQFIYAFEWFHRLLGRLIGIAFFVPLVWFWAMGRLPPGLKPKLVAVLGLGALQGAVGWWMVKSGLSERVEVSQYRLALHLLLASVTYAALLWLAVGLVRPRTGDRAGWRLRRVADGVLALVFLQIGLGALVAGLRAGLTYNTWPLMDGRLVPPAGDLFDKTPLWSNFFENVTLVQFQHRLVAYVLLAVVLAQAFATVRIAGRSAAARRAVTLAALVTLQAAVGITTLLLVVPLWAGLLHQAVAMLVLGMAVIHRRRLDEEAATAA